MFALSNRPFRNAGLALYGLGSLASLGLVSNQASAQTLPAASVARADSCDHFLKDRSPKGIENYVDCEIKEIRSRTAQNERSAATLRSESSCQEVLIKAIQSGKIQPAKVSAIYGDRPVGSIPACKVLEQLARG
jgi:hypothetical protein